MNLLLLNSTCNIIYFRQINSDISQLFPAKLCFFRWSISILQSSEFSNEQSVFASLIICILDKTIIPKRLIFCVRKEVHHEEVRLPKNKMNCHDDEVCCTPVFPCKQTLEMRCAAGIPTSSLREVGGEGNMGTNQKAVADTLQCTPHPGGGAAAQRALCPAELLPMPVLERARSVTDGN